MRPWSNPIQTSSIRLCKGNSMIIKKIKTSASYTKYWLQREPQSYWKFEKWIVKGVSVQETPTITSPAWILMVQGWNTASIMNRYTIQYPTKTQYTHLCLWTPYTDGTQVNSTILVLNHSLHEKGKSTCTFQYSYKWQIHTQRSMF